MQKAAQSETDTARAIWSARKRANGDGKTRRNLYRNPEKQDFSRKRRPPFFRSWRRHGGPGFLSRVSDRSVPAPFLLLLPASELAKNLCDCSR